jgi:hypothetical protein
VILIFRHSLTTEIMLTPLPRTRQRSGAKKSSPPVALPMASEDSEEGLPGSNKHGSIVSDIAVEML